MDNLVVIIRGIIQDIDILKDKFKGYPIIWSTWDSYISKFTSEDITVLSSPPQDAGIKHLYYQQINILNGLSHAKLLGYNKALVWRGDMIPTNLEKLIKLFKDGLNMTCFHNVLDGYYVDYFIMGDIEDITKVWTFPQNNYPYAEYPQTQNINKYNLNPNLILGGLNLENDIMWGKNQVKISDYKKQLQFSYG